MIEGRRPEEIVTFRLRVAHELSEPNALERVGLFELGPHLLQLGDVPDVGSERCPVLVDDGVVNVLPTASRESTTYRIVGMPSRHENQHGARLSSTHASR